MDLKRFWEELKDFFYKTNGKCTFTACLKGRFEEKYSCVAWQSKRAMAKFGGKLTLPVEKTERETAAPVSALLKALVDQDVKSSDVKELCAAVLPYGSVPLKSWYFDDSEKKMTLYFASSSQFSSPPSGDALGSAGKFFREDERA